MADTVANFDQRLLTIKGWDVTFSLAAIALGFQQNQYGHRPLRPLAVYAYSSMAPPMRPRCRRKVYDGSAARLAV